jgi:hypothetical protein
MTIERSLPGEATLRCVRALIVHVTVLCAIALLPLGHATATAGRAGAAEAVGAGALSVAIHVSSDGNRCYDPGLVAAIRHFTSRYAEQVNASGGIHGLSLKPVIFDDFESADRTTANVAKALQDPATIAMLGVPSSTRERKVFEKLGDDIRNVAIPFITEMSLDEIFADAPNVFTMASSVGNELEVVRRMIASGGYARPVFVGLDNDLYSFALEEGIAFGQSAPVGRFRVPVRDYQLAADVARETAGRIAELGPDLIVLSIHSGPTAKLLNDLTRLGVDAPVLILLGRVASVTRNLDPAGYGRAISQIAREGVPNVYSERLRARIWRSPGDRWVFENVKNPAAPGWQNNRCIESNVKERRRIYDPANRRAVGRGT